MGRDCPPNSREAIDWPDLVSAHTSRCDDPCPLLSFYRLFSFDLHARHGTRQAKSFRLGRLLP
jgi:hypothetical protein